MYITLQTLEYNLIFSPFFHFLLTFSSSSSNVTLCKNFYGTSIMFTFWLDLLWIDSCDARWFNFVFFIFPCMLLTQLDSLDLREMSETSLKHLETDSHVSPFVCQRWKKKEKKEGQRECEREKERERIQMHSFIEIYYCQL